MTKKTNPHTPDGLLRWGLKINENGRVVDVEHVDNPEFVDAPGLRRNFGIKRSLAYDLMGRGLIRGVSLRQPGALKGKRLFFVASVRAYLHSQLEGQQHTENAAKLAPAEKAAAAIRPEKVVAVHKKVARKVADAPVRRGRGRPRKAKLQEAAA